MPGNLIAPPDAETQRGSGALSAAIARASFADCAVTLVGAGVMGRRYLEALRALGVRRIRVVSRSEASLDQLPDRAQLETVSGGIERFAGAPRPNEMAIVATPMACLIDAAERMAQLGFSRLLIEKPVSLWPDRVERLARALQAAGVEAACAYNRVAYPSFHELRDWAAREGGITSCTYTFTERIGRDWPARFSGEELARWGIANSLHVMSMAHGLIGWPAALQGHRAGALTWHPTGAVFVGSGLSEHGIAFSYHADWGSTGRWSVEVHTPAASYRLCPLEQVFRRASPTDEWSEVPVTAFAPHVKTGVAEQVAAALDASVREWVPQLSLDKTAALIRYGELVFGYRHEART